jgi:hypothetical protein
VAAGLGAQPQGWLGLVPSMAITPIKARKAV